MPYINLIQEQRLAAQTNERRARSFFLLFVGSLVASGSAFGVLTMESMLTSSKAANVEAQNRRNAPLVAQIADNGRQLSELSPRLKTLEDAQTVTDRWNRVLNHLAVQTPGSAWLTGLRCQGTDATKPIQVSFIGIAGSQSPVGEFILRLQNQADLENVNLKYTNEKLIATASVIEFEVDCDVVGTAEQKVKTEEESK